MLDIRSVAREYKQPARLPRDNRYENKISDLFKRMQFLRLCSRRRVSEELQTTERTAALRRWIRFVKYLRFTAAVAALEKEELTNYVASKFQEFSELLIVRQLVGELVEETLDETDHTVPLRVLEYGQWLQRRAAIFIELDVLQAGRHHG